MFTVIATAPLLSACGGVMDPHGPVGISERLILLDSLAIMLTIVIPLILATFGVAWWFRDSNTHAVRRPNWAFSGTLELLVWAIPAIVVTFLGGIAWFGSHSLDPYRALSSPATPVEVEVVSLDWKWLFIYPNEGVATVNQLVIPVGAPVHFRLTSSSVMNSFFIPQLGSQIYTMAGMSSQLSLQANQAGSYRGLSAQFSGAGFTGMHFNVQAVSSSAYVTWINHARTSSPPLDRNAYAVLTKPSQNVPPAIYRLVFTGLFDAIVNANMPAAVRRGALDRSAMPVLPGTRP